MTIFGSIFAGQVHLSLGTDKDVFFIGDHIPLRYTISIPRNADPRVADAKEWIDNAEVLEQKSMTRRKGRERILRWELEVAAFDTGHIHIPSMPLVLDYQTGLRDTIHTPETTLYVRTILDTDAVPIAMNPPLPLTLMRWWQYLISGLLLVTALLLLWYGIKYRTKRKEEIKIPESPYEKARHELDLLASRKFHVSGQWKTFYLELTHILRSFYEDIFFIHLQELTTTELLPVLRPYLKNEDYRDHAAFFQFADLVKFAKGTASEAQCGEHLEFVKKIISEKEREYHGTETLD